MNDILEIISNTDQISDEVIDLFKKNILKKQVKKGTILQRSGDITTKAYYVKTGLLKSYIIDKEGKEHIFLFAPEGWLITDVELFSNNKSLLFIEALEDSRIEIITNDIFKKINLLPSSLLTIEINKLIKRIGTLQKRVLMLMSATAEERYIDFLEKYPNLIQRVSQKKY